MLGASAQLHTIEGLPLIGLRPATLAVAQFLKRALDIVGATLGLVVFMPFLALTALCIKLDSRGPVLFRQVRMGAGERSFRVFKFRTMVADADAMKDQVAHLNMHLDDDPRMFKVPNDPRVTRVGAYLRRFRIDELPQFLNVIRGEMSLVGRGRSSSTRISTSSAGPGAASSSSRASLGSGRCSAPATSRSMR